MTAASKTGAGSATPDGSGAPGQACREYVRLRMRGLCAVCRQVFGIPDYERYLAHATQRHPGEPLLTRGEFCAREFERKYGKGGARCC